MKVGEGDNIFKNSEHISDGANAMRTTDTGKMGESREVKSNPNPFPDGVRNSGFQPQDQLIHSKNSDGREDLEGRVSDQINMDWGFDPATGKLVNLEASPVEVSYPKEYASCIESYFSVFAELKSSGAVENEEMFAGRLDVAMLIQKTMAGFSDVFTSAMQQAVNHLKQPLDPETKEKLQQAKNQFMEDAQKIPDDSLKNLLLKVADDLPLDSKIERKVEVKGEAMLAHQLLFDPETGEIISG